MTVISPKEHLKFRRQLSNSFQSLRSQLKNITQDKYPKDSTTVDLNKVHYKHFVGAKIDFKIISDSYCKLKMDITLAKENNEKSEAIKIYRELGGFNSIEGVSNKIFHQLIIIEIHLLMLPTQYYDELFVDCFDGEKVSPKIVIQKRIK